MKSTHRILAALLPLLAVAACSDSSNPTGLPNTATVRFVNATTTSIDVTNALAVDPGNGALGQGSHSSCLVVNTSNTAGLGIGFNQAGTTTAIPGFTQNFTDGGTYTVVAYPDASGTTQFMTIDDTDESVASGQSGVKVVNLVPTATSIVAQSDGTVLGTGAAVNFGAAGAFNSVAAGTHTLTFTSGGANIGTTGPLSFVDGEKYVIFLRGPSGAETTNSAFSAPIC